MRKISRKYKNSKGKSEYIERKKMNCGQTDKMSNRI